MNLNVQYVIRIKMSGLFLFEGKSTNRITRVEIEVKMNYGEEYQAICAIQHISKTSKSSNFPSMKITSYDMYLNWNILNVNK